MNFDHWIIFYISLIGIGLYVIFLMAYQKKSYHISYVFGGMSD